MKNLSKPEIYKKFAAHREDFKPYGLTMEKWEPSLMPRFDRHNEIEINYFPEGSITYMIKDRKVVIPPKRIAVFWGLVPHQIIEFVECEFYYVCTLPLNLFLSWNLSDEVTDSILHGMVLIDKVSEDDNDSYRFETWYNDINGNINLHAAMLEMNARMLRFQKCLHETEAQVDKAIHQIPGDRHRYIEKMSMFIARNYSKGIQVSDVSNEIGLHPDYANSLFRKAFGCTISEYIMMEKVTEAQRRLILTEESITNIAYDCGFNSISSFNNSFKRANGCTPREYRHKTMNKTKVI